MSKNEETFTKLSSFVSTFWYVDSICIDTRIEKDLFMTGDDAYEFLIEYGKLFNVDISMFKFSEYFGDEGLDFIGYILEQLNIKKRKVRKDLTIEHLIKGIKAGRLDDDILSNP